MFYPATINGIAAKVSLLAPTLGLRRRGTEPGPHALALCDEVRELNTESAENAAKAATLTAEVMQTVLRTHWFEPLELDALWRQDHARRFHELHPHQCLAIDFRNVIRVQPDEGEHYYPPAMLRTVRELVSLRFGREVYIMYRSFPANPEGHRKSLEEVGFFLHTGVLPNHIVTYKTREKTVDECRRLKVSHYISRRREILYYAAETARVLLLFGNKRPEDDVPERSDIITPVMDHWKRIGPALLDTAARK